MRGKLTEFQKKAEEELKAFDEYLGVKKWYDERTKSSKKEMKKAKKKGDVVNYIATYNEYKHYRTQSRKIGKKLDEADRKISEIGKKITSLEKKKR